MFKDLPRRLLLVEANPDCLALERSFIDWGWTVEHSTLKDMRSQRGDVALFCLHPSQCIDQAKAVIGHSHAEWIALVSPASLAGGGVGEFIYEWFFDFHCLPLDPARMRITLGRASGMARLRQLGAQQVADGSAELLGTSEQTLALRTLISKLAVAESPVLIRGESGTGKELVARSLYLASRRANQPFSALNCGAISEHLIQSELFGHEKGAFTGAHQRKIGRIEAVNGGTLFLDEIGDLPLELQANLLRFLQEKNIERVGSNVSIPVDVRVIAATHIDLERAVEQGRFREDLYYRLNVLQVETTPLRERPEDIPTLAAHFAQLYSGETGKRARRFSSDAQRAMLHYAWPGNVRELANRVRRGLVLSEGQEINAAELGLDCLQGAPLLSLELCKQQAERRALKQALALHAGNLSSAALALGISRPTFYRLLHKHQIR